MNRESFIFSDRVQGNRPGFTLVELLIVIAIITLLVAILLPALSKAKAAAIRVKCAMNLKGQGQAWHEYLLDSNGKFYQERNAHVLYGGWIGQESLDTLSQQTDANLIQQYELLLRRPLNPYAGVPRLLKSPVEAKPFICPGDVEDSLLRNHYQYGTSYFTNPLLVGNRLAGTLGDPILDGEVDNYLIKGTRLDAVGDPSDLFLVGDLGWWAKWENEDWRAAWHEHPCRYNIAFVDGHVSFEHINTSKLMAKNYRLLPFKKLFGLYRSVEADIVDTSVDDCPEEN
jgi:prepilin-type N-terminal cleavage/methylation domain-containing protein/prepilin-type processing-associated H-X9-DG protein